MHKFIIIISIFVISGCITTPQSRRAAIAPPKERLDANNFVNTKLEDARTQNFSVLRTQMAIKGVGMNKPMLIRAFKSEMKLELWVQSNYSKRYKLFRTYNVCSKSGVLGPKIKEGDKQTPEGFYSVTKARLNPNSKYFLSFNIGYPNSYDRSLGRTGSNLMIHGNCVSVGCLAMRDDNIAEIYLIIEQNFKYGHKSVPVHIYPFRMTQENMMARNNSRWYPFWENLKQGYDYFEQHNHPASISAKNNQYAFNVR